MAAVPYRELSINPNDLVSEDSNVRNTTRSAINDFFMNSNYFDFSPEAITNMARLIGSDLTQQEREEAIISYIEENRGLIHHAVTEAHRSFVLHNSLEAVRGYEKHGQKEMNELIASAEKFYNQLPKINFDKLPTPRSPEEYLYHFLADGKDYKKEIERWKDSVCTIERIISDLKCIQASMRKRRKGRPEYLDGLKTFVIEIALMYQKVSGKELKVNKLSPSRGGKNAPVTDSMLFIFSAMEVVNKGRTNYTPESIYTSCEYAKKVLKKIAPINSKKK